MGQPGIHKEEVINVAECKATEKCDALKELEKRVDDHDDRLAKGDTSFAVVNVKLNLILGVLPYGTKVKILEEKGKWGRIVYNDKTGWIALSYTRKV